MHVADGLRREPTAVAVTVFQERRVQLLDVEGAQGLEAHVAEPIGDTAEPGPVVAQRRRTDLGADRDEPPLDPLPQRLRIGA